MSNAQILNINHIKRVKKMTIKCALLPVWLVCK